LQPLRARLDTREGAENIITELLWRAWYAMLLRRYGSGFLAAGGVLELPVRWDSTPERLVAWQAGQTGFPIVDAAMRQLAQTGTLSWKARQIVAHFYTKYLGLDWRKGAEWFAQQLWDYSPANTLGNWAWIAGVLDDARVFRYLDMLAQAKKHDADGLFVRHWLPELAGLSPQVVHTPWRLEATKAAKLGFRLGQHYPLPIVSPADAIFENEARFMAALTECGKTWRRSMLAVKEPKHKNQKGPRRKQRARGK
jgi:deoxyribodipyrimidine photo-lyase